MNLCGICDIFIQFYHVTTSPISQLFKNELTWRFLWYFMILFPGGQLILASSVCNKYVLMCGLLMNGVLTMIA